MNINDIKANIIKMLGKKVVVREYIGRNKHEIYDAIVQKSYPNLFILSKGDEVKTFSYSDILVKNIILKVKE